jgi:DNA-binding transcriptional MerR regulator
VTRTNRTRGFILLSLLTTTLILASSSIIFSAIAENQGTAPDPQPPSREPPWMSQLTDDQKTEIQQLTQSMKDSGASQQEIRDAINAKLQEWGIEVPEVPLREPPWISQLTDDQKTQIEQMVQSMKDSGATPQEIRDALKAKLQEWGIQLPELRGGQPTNSTRPLRDPPWMSQLTDDQKVQIQQLIESLRASGATPHEIRDAVNAKLQELGIQLPAPPQSSGQ